MASKNHLRMEFLSCSENVGIARVAAAAFAAQVDFTLGTIEEIKVAVSEAVSNAVIHGYRGMVGTVTVVMTLHEDYLEIIVSDQGRGIADIALARQPSYSSDPERMGLGFVFMESFMDELHVTSQLNQGTTVRMVKRLPLENNSH